jgi:hypothetical protein
MSGKSCTNTAGALDQMILPKGTDRVRIPHSVYLPLYATEFRIDHYQWSYHVLQVYEEADRLHADRAQGRNGRRRFSRWYLVGVTLIRALVYEKIIR